MRKDELSKIMKMVCFSVNCEKKDQDTAKVSLSTALNVDFDSISYEKKKVWTEVSFDSLDQAEEYITQSRSNLDLINKRNDSNYILIYKKLF